MPVHTYVCVRVFNRSRCRPHIDPVSRSLLPTRSSYSMCSLGHFHVTSCSFWSTQSTSGLMFHEVVLLRLSIIYDDSLILSTLIYFRCPDRSNSVTTGKDLGTLLLQPSFILTSVDFSTTSRPLRTLFRVPDTRHLCALVVSDLLTPSLLYFGERD